MAKITEEEIYDYLYCCCYCCSFTGDDTTGCAGRPTPCRHFCLDSITIPRWAKEFLYLSRDEEDDW